MSLHPEQLKSMYLTPKDTGVVLVTRHSIREQATNDMPGFDIPLTAEGVELAREWGGSFPQSIRQIYSSHSPRCVHTGEAILEGAGTDANISVAVHEMLCEPGCYVEKMSVAGKTFVEVGPVEFVSRTLQGTVEGAFDARQGTRQLLGLLRDIQPETGEISLCITHDTILSSFVYELAGKKNLHREDWPWMPEGVFVWFDKSHVHWIWRGVGNKAPLGIYFD